MPATATRPAPTIMAALPRPRVPRRPDAGARRLRRDLTRWPRTHAGRRVRDRVRPVRAAAFEVHAVDYLLKPFDRERFQASLHRAKERLRAPVASELERQVRSLLDELRSGQALPRPARREEGRPHPVPQDRRRRPDRGGRQLRAPSSREVSVSLSREDPHARGAPRPALLPPHPPLDPRERRAHPRVHPLVPQGLPRDPPGRHRADLEPQLQRSRCWTSSGTRPTRPQSRSTASPETVSPATSCASARGGGHCACAGSGAGGAPVRGGSVGRQDRTDLPRLRRHCFAAVDGAQQRAADRPVCVRVAAGPTWRRRPLRAMARAAADKTRSAGR